MTDPKITPAAEATDAKGLRPIPTADDCSNCGLSYCDCEVCDDKGTVQVAPAEA